MATADKLTEHYLTCIICAEVFKDPATLHCDHTFCRQCLVKYIKTQPDAIQAKSIPCPNCRQMTRITSPEKPVEDWVNQVQLSRIMVGLMDDFGPGKESSYANLGDMCQHEGETTLATSWCPECEESFCDNCLRMHRRVSQTRDHEVTSLTGESKSKRRSRFMCTEHKEEQVKLFCKDCNTAICHTCCSINHRQCKTVVTIESMMSEVSIKLENKIDVARKIIKEKTQRVSQQKTRVEEIATNCEATVREIKEVSQTVVDLIRKKETKLLDDVSRLRDEQMEVVKAGMKSEEIDIRMHQQQLEFIERAVKSGCHRDMFVMYQSGGDVTGDGEETQMKKEAVGKIKFVHDVQKLTKIVSDVRLGKITDMSCVSDLKYSAVLHHTIDFRMKEDTSSPNLMDVSVLAVPGGKITVVTDFHNHTVKADYSLQSTSYKIALNINYSPWQLAKISHNELAMSCAGGIAFVKFNPDPQITAVTETPSQYYGLACQTTTHFVGGSDDGLTIFDNTGNCIKTIADVTEEPDYISVAKSGNMVVSDNTMESILSVTSDGKVNFTYHPTGDLAIKSPRGITTTDSGDVLFADSDSNNVIQLTEEGQFIRDVLTEEDGLVDPHGLCLDDDGLLYVTTKQFVKVFKFV